jgi:hypothetical protein
MLRISVSDLESYRYWKDSEESDLDQLVARLLHKDPPTPQMGAGKALARLFEHAQAGAFVDESVDGWNFHFQLDGELRLPVVSELKAEEVFETPSGPVTLVGMVDGLDGRTVHDQKLSEKFDAERYVDSLQWRAYLAMFGAREFVYDVFVGRYGKDEEEGHVTIYDYHRLQFFAYPNMRADVEKAVNELAEVITRYVPEKVVA